MLRFKSSPLVLLKEAGYSSTRLRYEKIFGSATIQKLRHRKMVSAHELDLLCSFLHCQPGDILEYCDEDETEAISDD